MRAVWLVVLCGCRQLLGFDEATPPGDGTVAPPTECAALGATCASPTLLRTCTVVGELPVDTACSWGCISDSPHCGRLHPTGGAATSADVDPDSQLAEVTLPSGVLFYAFDTGTGEITDGMANRIRDPGPGVNHGIGFDTPFGRGVAVFRFKSLRIQDPVGPFGPNAIVIAADGEIVIEDLVDVRAGCTTRTPGLAAGAGGLNNATGDSTGAGTGGGGGQPDQTDASGGGGGGNGTAGAAGGDTSLGVAGGKEGATAGAAPIPILVTAGGGGGGGGGGAGGGAGGGGGGVIQLISNTRIAILSGGINAGGCGGHHATDSASAGGGGGAGGTIVLEAPIVEVLGGLAVNGGGGGGGETAGDGANGQLSIQAASGGSSPNAGDGGAGGASVPPEAGHSNKRAGGGGGAAGWIRINTLDGALSGMGGFTSPSLGAQGSTATQGTASVK